MSNGTPALSKAESFDVLVDVVREWRTSGRKTTTAGLKPALQQRTSGAFSERTLGFASFRDFLQAAEADGVVRLWQAPTHHWWVLLPGEEESDVLKAGTNRGPHSVARLDPSVWRAFVSWSDDRRLWDRKTGRAITFPVADDGSPAWEHDSARFVAINPLGEDIQSEWLRVWAQNLDGPVGGIIVTALERGDPPALIWRLIDALELKTSWRRHLESEVMKAVSNWAVQEGIKPESLSRMPARRGASPTETDTAEPVPESSSVERPAGPDLLRRRVHAAIDAMSASELEQLQVPARFLVM